MIVDGAIVNADINASAEIAVSKLANGTARQLLQTDAGGSGVEFTSNVDVPGTLDVTSGATFDSTVAVTGLLSANGKLAYPAGTAAAVSLYSGSDTDTGIYSPGSNQFGISTAGTSRVVIDSSGRLLVGTTSNYASANADNLVIGDNSSSTESGITLGSTTVSGIRFADSAFSSSGIIEYDHSTNHLGFFTSATEQMRIDISGNVGIGTSNPAHELHVSDSDKPEIVAEDTTNGVKTYLGAADTNGRIGTLTNHDLKIFTNNTEQMVIGSSGNVGIGRTDPEQLLHLSSTNTFIALSDSADSGAAGLLFRRTDNDQNRGSITYDFSNDSMAFRASTNGAGESMRIDSSGRLLVGTSSSSTNDTLVLQGNSAGSAFGAQLRLRRNATISSGSGIGDVSFEDGSGNQYAVIGGAGDGTSGSGDYPGRLVFSTTADGASSPTERMRLKHSGILEVKSNTARQASFGTLDGSFHSAENFIQIYSGSTDNFLLLKACNANDGTPILDSNVLGARRIEIEADGDIFNQNDVYGQLSDAKLKENIVDVSSQWDDIKALRVRNFNFREDLGYQPNTQIGFVAQEVEQVSPGLVKSVTDSDSDGNDLGTKTKVVKTSVLHVKAVKALQEAMARIEELEAKVAALEAG